MAPSLGEARSALPLLARILDDHPLRGGTGDHRHAELWRALLAGALPRARAASVRAARRARLGRALPRSSAPDATLWVESELWPNMLAALAARGVPAALVNARLSDASYRALAPDGAALRPPLGAFDRVRAQSDADAARFAALGARQVATPGNLKFDAPVLPAEDGAGGAARTRRGTAMLARREHASRRGGGRCRGA
jgi:3-deoxy-D-manno-octulosonic-acid transferase